MNGDMFGLTKRRKIGIMAAAMAALLLAGLDQTIVGTAMPRIVADLNGFDQLSWVVTAYLLTSTVMVPISGKLSDIYGRRPLLLIGIFVFVLGSVLAGASQDMAQLILFRGVQGIGGGILFSNVFAIVGDLFPPAERAKWQGMIGAVFGLSSIIGPLLGGWLTDNASWRWTFYINVPVGIFAFAMIAAMLPKVREIVKTTIDYFGAALLGGGLVCLLLALVWGGNEYAWDSVEIALLFVSATGFTGLFAVNEALWAKDPILPLGLFKNSIFSVASFIMFILGMAMMGLMLYIPMFAQNVLGVSATNSGVIVIPMVFGMLFTSIGTGQIVARTGKYKIFAMVGTAGMAGCAYWLSTMTAATSDWDMTARMVVTGAFMGMIMPVVSLAVQNAFPQSKIGVVTAATQLFRNIGATVGVAVMASTMNGELTKRISGLSDSQFAKMATAKGFDFNDIDINKLQVLLTPDTQEKIGAQLAALPVVTQKMMMASYDGFMATSRGAIAESISVVFVLSAGFIAAGFAAALFLREIPLRRGHEVVAGAEGAGLELAAELGDFAAEDEPRLDRKAATNGRRRTRD